MYTYMVWDVLGSSPLFSAAVTVGLVPRVPGVHIPEMQGLCACHVSHEHKLCSVSAISLLPFHLPCLFIQMMQSSAQFWEFTGGSNLAQATLIKFGLIQYSAIPGMKPLSCPMQSVYFVTTKGCQEQFPGERPIS